ncbi:DUF2948 family protein [Actibacterium sp. 188UL27-1]|uniref:DUF2948 family protein n=1 Tax=Actibacterium sp. 188UL27-1 TaxID=2786961 RepID=UPI001958D59D|nr:DUF2948 family protein [Actibacterium sp. 188UL27-1]MBM7068790.1 DUF2948 family protein [Actibacterium sp. 188UL27-1]
MTDARFEDGGERPLHLKATEVEDLQVLSSLVQDAVFPITEMRWDRQKRQFAILLNRFRWEDKANAESRKRAYERVQSVFLIADVLKVQSQGVDRSDTEMVLSVLDVRFQPAEEGAGQLVLTLAGDGAIAVHVECLDVILKDVTRPYLAPSGKAPDHPE